jgi:peptidylprolyl isomerase
MKLRLMTGMVAAGIVAAAIATMHAQEPKSVPAPADVKAPPATAAKTKSGLASRVLTPGKGTSHPASDDLVTVHYTGWTTDGKTFDSSVGDQPATFPLDRVIAGWTEGVQLMVAGEKRRLWIPEALAYKGREGRPKGMLVFDVELLSFTTSPSKPPADVKQAPADAKHTASGISYKVIKAGTGTRHPRATDRVTVHYTGWTTDGKMFDSSVQRGEPTTFGLNQVIAGWTEGVQLMVEGEKTRFWIPESLAYKGQQPPFGLLVFDIELLKIN